MRNRVFVKATELDENGAGVGVAEGKTIHASGLLPGESGDVEIEHVSPHADEAWGHAVAAPTPPSPDRVIPPCPAAGSCGGCVWQHLRYEAQLMQKRVRVQRALKAVTSCDVSAVVAAQPKMGYRSKAKYVVGLQDGQLSLGAFAPRTHRFVETLGCQIVEPILDEIAAWVQSALRATAAKPYDERRKTGDVRFVVLRSNRAGDVLVGLVLAPGVRGDIATSVGRSLRAHPAVRGVVWLANSAPSSVIVPSASEVHLVWGDRELQETIAGVEVAVGIGAFTQAHAAAADTLYAKVAELVAPEQGESVLDLFAGLGGHSFALAQRGAFVSAIEQHAPAVAALQRAAVRADLSIAADVGDATRARVADASTIVVNPPRKGLGAELCVRLAESEARQIIYVSCNPESLARDLKSLGDSGFTATAIVPFDLMPGTSHVETVVRLERPSAARPSSRSRA